MKNDNYVVDAALTPLATPDDVMEAAGTLWLHATAVYGADGFYRAVDALTIVANPGE